MSAFDRRSMLHGLITMAAAGVLGRSLSASRQSAAASGGRILVFDVNETLLDVGALSPHFDRLFGDARVGDEWFTNVVLYSQVAALAGPYAEFGAIARAALDMTATAHRVSLSPADRDGILRGLISLPAHPDVRDGLDTLRQAGFRLVTLTNSAPAAVAQQLANAGIAEFFEQSFSVDEVRTFKPATQVYQLVATKLGVAPSQLRLVAAHAWDVLGAMRAGLMAAFVARPGKALFPLADRPDVVGPDLREVARQIVLLETQ
ncbi:MAG: haloacid dehalogenase type II [Vicinamibacterales bacterium]